MYNAYITRVKNIRKHINADRLNIGECFGSSVIISLDIQESELGVYFPTDGRLGMEFCEKNNLLRKKDGFGNQVGGYLEPEKRHVSTLKLRGEKGDGLFMPLKCLESFCDISELKEGDTITTLNEVLICEKYVPRGRKNSSGTSSSSKKTKKIDEESYPLFQEHIDTSQLAYNTHQFKEGDICYITLKMHGTSQRTSYTIKEKARKIPYLLRKALKPIGIDIKPKKTWDNVTGTRRVVLKGFDSGFYGGNDFRKQYHDHFTGKLRKGETVYYEVVGYTGENQTIMPECSNKKTKDKEFTKQYGETTKFTYGCENGQSDIYVYRMTMTNEDGDVVEYSTEFTKLRCEQMGVKFVPVLDKFIFTTVEDLMERVNKYIDGADPIGLIHIREGIVVRIENREKFSAYKHKNFYFKVLESIIKIDDVLDMEEAENIV